MATSTLISPGVLALENDNSFISQQPVTVGAALIGPTVKGPVEVPTIVTSYSAYQNRFGTTFLSGSNVYTYFTSVAAFNYFNRKAHYKIIYKYGQGIDIRRFPEAHTCFNAIDVYGFPNNTTPQEKEKFLYDNFKIAVEATGMELR